MVECGKHDAVPDLAAVAEGDAAVVLEVAAVVDKDLFAQVYVLAEVGIERGKYPNRCRYGLAGKLGKQFAYLVGGVVRAVHLAGDAPGLVAHLVHKLSDLGAAKRFAFGRMFQKFFESHGCLLILSIDGRMLRFCRRE